MALNAPCPSLARSCARYKLAGSTSWLTESNVPSLRTGLPEQPTHQFMVPGGCSTWRKGERTFQATAQPISQPCPEPMVFRLENEMPGVRSVEPLKVERSTNSPVAQRWCGATPRSLLLQSRSTMGPVTVAWVTKGHVPSPFTLERATRTCVPEREKSAGAAEPVWVSEWM